MRCLWGIGKWNQLRGSPVAQSGLFWIDVCKEINQERCHLLGTGGFENGPLMLTQARAFLTTSMGVGPAEKLLAGDPPIDPL